METYSFKLAKTPQFSYTRTLVHRIYSLDTMARDSWLPVFLTSKLKSSISQGISFISVLLFFKSIDLENSIFRKIEKSIRKQCKMGTVNGVGRPYLFPLLALQKRKSSAFLLFL